VKLAGSKGEVETREDVREQRAVELQKRNKLHFQHTVGGHDDDPDAGRVAAPCRRHWPARVGTTRSPQAGE
jgi:hypothetical protein